MSKRHALVIGISKYQHLESLPNVINDVNDIATSLQTLNRIDNRWEVERYPSTYIEEQNCYKLKQSTVRHDRLLTKIETFLFDTARNGEALVYFAGHGLRVAGTSSRIAAKGYLATTDSHDNGQNAILLADLNLLFSQARKEAGLSSLIVILDCCHAGMAFEGVFEKEWLKGNFREFEQEADFGILAACRGHKKAYEKAGHGLFTKAVLEGLKSPNPNTGMVTLFDLAGYLGFKLVDSGQQSVCLGVNGQNLKIVCPEKSLIQIYSGNKIEQFLKIFKKFNYRKSDRVFQEFIDESDRRVGAFWIRGKRDSAQKWLLYRLWVNFVPGSTHAFKKTLKIRAGSTITEVWQQIGSWLNTNPEPAALVEELIAQWQNQKTVAIVFYEIERLLTDDLKTLIEKLWIPLVQKTQDDDLDTPLLLFFVDLGCKGERLCPIAYRTTYDSQHPEKIVELTADRFEDRDFRWATDHGIELQPYLNGLCPTKLKDKAIQCNQQTDVRPLDVLIELCDYCGVNWDRDVANKFLAS